MKEQKHKTCLKCNRLLLIYCIKLKSYHIYNCADNQGKFAIMILLHHIMISVQKSGTHYWGTFEHRNFTPKFRVIFNFSYFLGGSFISDTGMHQSGFKRNYTIY